jgi:hypothetical protein
MLYNLYKLFTIMTISNTISTAKIICNTHLIRSVYLRKSGLFVFHPTKRYNLSYHPLVVNDVEQKTYHPIGLWYAFGDEWYDDNYSPYTVKYRYINELDVSDLNILEVNKDNIDWINKTYGCNRTINWKEVAKEFDGVEISEGDLVYGSGTWQSCFSYKSGCIWKNQNKIKIVESKLI